MKNLLLSALLLVAVQYAWAETVPFGKGQLTVKYVAKNAVRIQYDEGEKLSEEDEKAYTDKLTDIFRKALDNKDLKVKVDSLKDVKVLYSISQQI